MPRTLSISIVGDTKNVKRAFAETEKASHGLGKAMKVGLGAAAVGAGAAIGGLAVAAKIGFDEFNEAQKVSAQTAAVLKSTGGAANVTAKEIEGLAGALMRKSGVDDEAIQSGANVLATFTRIRNETGAGNKIFNEATKSALDMSVALGKDLNSSAMLVGKSLNDPIKGMGALSKAGVQLTEDQKETIKAMVASGNTMGAQKVLLKELETQFGGSAEAAGKTFSGQLNVAKQTLSNFAGEMVGKAMPAVAGLLTKFSDILPKLTDFAAAFRDDIKPVITGVRDFVRDHLAPIFTSLKETAVTTWQRIAAVFKENEPEIREIMDGLKKLMAGVEVVVRELVLPIVRLLFTEVLPRVINIAIDAIALFTKAITSISGFITSLREKFSNFWAWLKESALNAALAVVEPFSHLPKRLGGWAREAKDSINAELDKIRTDREIRISARIFASLSEGAQNAPDNRGDGRVGAGLAAAADGVIDAWIAQNMGPIVRSVAPAVARNPGGLSPRILDELGIAQAMGLTLSSGYRPGAITSTGRPSLHGIGQAIDVAGSGSQMAAFARTVAGRPGIAEVLYTPVGGWYPSAGWTRLSGQLAADHYDHVHVGTYAQGGIFTKPTLGIIGEAGPEAVIPLGRGGAMGGDLHVHIGTVIGTTLDRAADEIHRALLRKQGRNAGLGFT